MDTHVHMDNSHNISSTQVQMEIGSNKTHYLLVKII